MKKFFITGAMIASLFATVFLACNKPQSTQVASDTFRELSPEGKLVLEKINRFFELREAYHSNSRIDNGYITVDEAESFLDVAINYEFSDINRFLTETELDTVWMTAPALNEQGMVAMNDIINVYDRFAERIASQSDGVNFFMIQYPKGANRSDDDICIVFTQGTGQPPTPPSVFVPFQPDDDWIWGMNNGKCDIGGDSDAAQELTKKFVNNNSIPDIPIGGPTPINPIWDIDYGEIKADSLLNTENCSIYWLFYAVVEPGEDISSYCIPDEEMNCYWRSIRRNVIFPSGCFHYSKDKNSPYRIIKIIDNPNNYPIIFHCAKVTYYKMGAFN